MKSCNQHTKSHYTYQIVVILKLCKPTIEFAIKAVHQFQCYYKFILYIPFLLMKYICILWTKSKNIPISMELHFFFSKHASHLSFTIFWSTIFPSRNIWASIWGDILLFILLLHLLKYVIGRIILPTIIIKVNNYFGFFCYSKHLIFTFTSCSLNFGRTRKNQISMKFA